MELDFDLVFVSMAVAVVAYVYSAVLTEPGMILSPWYIWLDKKIGNKPYLFKPLIGCIKCVAGQFAFWFYLIYCSNENYSIRTGGYSLFEHLFFISFTIFIVGTIHKIYQWQRS